MRTDTHRPSAIIPEEYCFVALGYQREDQLIDFERVAYERKVLRSHMEKTGGTFSGHDHGGTCHICGAWAVYTVYFYHEISNKYIITGCDCAEKLDMGDGQAFQSFQKACRNERTNRAGKAKAQAILSDAGLSVAWTIYQAGTSDKKEENIVRDIVSRLVKWGNVSKAQVKFLGVLLHKIDTREDRQAQWNAEKALAQDCPEGRIDIIGTVVKTEEKDFGDFVRYVMTVKSDEGFLLWGTVPKSLLDIARGSRVTFTGTVKVSDRDPKFGFFSRPAKGQIILEN